MEKVLWLMMQKNTVKLWLFLLHVYGSQLDIAHNPTFLHQKKIKDIGKFKYVLPIKHSSEIRGFVLDEMTND